MSTQTEEQQITLKKSTEAEEYKPTPYMEKWLDTAIQLETDNVTEISNVCGIDRSSWYKWLKEERFLDWFQKEWNKKLRGIGWKLDVIGLKNSKRQYQYWYAMQQRVGNIKENNTTITGDKVIAILGDVTAK